MSDARIHSTLLRSSMACAVAFLVLAGAVAVDGARLTGFDEAGVDRLFGFALDHDGFESLMRWVTALGDGWTVTVVAAGAALWCVARGRWVLGWWLVLVVAGSALLSTAVKHGVERVRPGSEGTLTSAHGFSFPSGHTQAATVTYTAVCLVVAWQLVGPGSTARRASVVLVSTLVAAVGLSRIFLGVHWPTDVLGGWLLGSAWVTGATYVLLAYVPPSGRADPAPDASRHSTQ